MTIQGGRLEHTNTSGGDRVKGRAVVGQLLAGIGVEHQADAPVAATSCGVAFPCSHIGDRGGLPNGMQRACGAVGVRGRHCQRGARPGQGTDEGGGRGGREHHVEWFEDGISDG